MTIKSYGWIKRISENNSMIYPFEEKQVKSLGNDSIISYGFSSYGYDICCAKDFKIFTNINSTIIDPKKFSEKNFIDFYGDVCFIPPNSFAFASLLMLVVVLLLMSLHLARMGRLCNVRIF